MVAIDVSLFEIFRGYSSLVAPRFFNIPSRINLSQLQDFFLHSLLTHPHLQQFPPSNQYQKVFWKWAIQVMESFLLNEDEEIDSRFYDYYLSLGSYVSESDKGDFSTQSTFTLSTPPSQSYITYYFPQECLPSSAINLDNLFRFTLLESRTMIENGTTGLRTWKASFVLGEFLLLNPGLVQEKRVLELGSGTGFLGTVIAAIQLQRMSPSTTLYLTDIDEHVLFQCRRNIELPCNLSATHPCICCRTLDWNSSKDDVIIRDCQTFLSECNAEIIVGADVVFDPKIIPALVCTLKLSLEVKAVGPRTAFIALTQRNMTTISLFLDELRGMYTVEYSTGFYLISCRCWFAAQ
ncbi:hypothetical protein AMATHDRAFT_140300 [Amanita thiersii Skay4041]|uniref:FAM86 N-terminal domain-containing protein n=1 Tax=Amanita thiersii Skay4041 TaxID=703135 RepID=A0A2A9NMZ6_9AGAR|nr:hypothetical protein AMATHDRAFT_140300 [Amanita thiersii Skay4041]